MELTAAQAGVSLAHRGRQRRELKFIMLHLSVAGIIFLACTLEKKEIRTSVTPQMGFIKTWRAIQCLFLMTASSLIQSLSFKV